MGNKIIIDEEVLAKLDAEIIEHKKQLHNHKEFKNTIGAIETQCRLQGLEQAKKIILENSTTISIDESIGVVMPRSLTAENGAKGLLIGEFFEQYEVFEIDEFGDEGSRFEKVLVTWSTIKAIYSKIVSHFATEQSIISEIKSREKCSCGASDFDVFSELEYDDGSDEPTTGNNLTDVFLLDFIDWFGSWQNDKNLSDYGINDILNEYKKTDDYKQGATEQSIISEIKSKWINTKNEVPICYESGNWDGKRSDLFVGETIEGKRFTGRCYEGIMDGSKFFDWYQEDELNHNDWLLNSPPVRWHKLQF